ncbi:MAG: hypothetical protein IKT29_01115 [Flavobacteriales bacterium]|nr:hypothetical protein [Flavobacteriales bacterium]
MDYLILTVPIGICVVLPIMIVWLVMRAKINETNKRTEILRIAIEKNTDIDIAEFIKKMNPPQKTLKEKLLNRLLCGVLFTVLGIGALFFGLISYCDVGPSAYIPSILFFPLGIAYLINYFVGKKMLKKEIEAELQSKK